MKHRIWNIELLFKNIANKWERWWFINCAVAAQIPRQQCIRLPLQHFCNLQHHRTYFFNFIRVLLCFTAWIKRSEMFTMTLKTHDIIIINLLITRTIKTLVIKHRTNQLLCSTSMSKMLKMDKCALLVDTWIHVRCVSFFFPFKTTQPRVETVGKVNQSYNCNQW